MNKDTKQKYLKRKEEKAKKTSSYVNLSDDIALSIIEALRKKGINKTVFAKKLGKDMSIVSRWLNGQHNFTLKTIVDIENALNQKIILPVNKIQDTSLIKNHVTILNFDLSFDKNDFSKVTSSNISGKKTILTNSFNETLKFNT